MVLEIYMKNVDWNLTKSQIIDEFVKILHGPNFQSSHSSPLNFHVHLHPDKNHMRPGKHKGTGALTLAGDSVGDRFLALHGSDKPRLPIIIGKKTVIFTASNYPRGRRDVVERLKLQPYIDHRIQERREKRAAELNEANIPIKVIQFGWECRDFVFSIECEHCANRSSLEFSDDKRELRIGLMYNNEQYFIAFSYSHINNMTVHNYLEEEPAIVFSLNTPPVYELKRPAPNLRQRLSYLPIEGHERVVPYTSLAIRLVCPSNQYLEQFRAFCSTAQLRRISEYEYPVERRELFSSVRLETLHRYLRRLNWCVAFQIEGLVRSLVVDVKEVLDLLPLIVQMINEKGKAFAANVIRKFSSRASLYWNEDDTESRSLTQLLIETKKQVNKHPVPENVKPSEGSLFNALHVTVTPTTYFLHGPFPERSNRVIRAYDTVNEESFLRVTFSDEGKLGYRFDRDVDGPDFIRVRVGPFLLNGLTIAGRKFEFLAYSQSALKEHAVWFVKPFRDHRQGFVNAQSIISGLGKFEEELMLCPARYAARLSQAFTATDAVEVEVEEILLVDDLFSQDTQYQFTDGVGTLSKGLSQDIWSQLKSNKKRRRSTKGAPSAYQIRFMGSKGMLSVDYKLKGNVICLRPSMVKFQAPESRNVEIARAFDRPGAYYLNRPLIMLLEGLGIPFKVFKKYQDEAVTATKKATESLGQAAVLFEAHGLGSSYRLPSILLAFEKLYINSLAHNKFYEKMLENSVNHVLRDLKNRARIPVPDAWTLVGIADVHRYLQAGEIFACVKPIDGKTRYLSGRVLISRSPTIHPGDVMIVNAIGQPPPGSCFAIENLANTVVFSTLGDRPVPSCLGGGDLDGDIYHLIPLELLPEFEPKQLYPPASYEPANKKLLDRPCTMADVAEFVMEYINSDVVGIIAINWLIIADQSPEGITDSDCLKLANLHSDAVDYPKSGQPVPWLKIPKLKSRTKPDWNAPETVNLESGDFYPSEKAIGRLFRLIDLPVVQDRSNPHPRQFRARTDNEIQRLEGSFNNFILTEARRDPIFVAIQDHVNQYIETDDVDEGDNQSISELFDRYASELQGICASCALSHTRRSYLTEEEAITGTITQKSSQPRLRKDMMSKLRENTDVLVRGMREEIAGDENTSPYYHLQRAWMAYEVSISKKQLFGAQSFAWISFGAIFEAIKEIEELEKASF